MSQQCISYQLHILEGNVFQRKGAFCLNDSEVSGPTGFNNQNSIFIFPFCNILYTSIISKFYPIDNFLIEPIARIIWARRYNLRSLRVTFNRNIYRFYFTQQCTICIFYFNNIYILIIPTCFDTFVFSLGSSKVVSLKLRSSYIIKISLKIIKLKYICGFCWQNVVCRILQYNLYQ